MASYIARRRFLATLGGAAARPLAGRAQQQATTKVPRIGWLVTGSPTSYRFSLGAFRDGLKALGYIEGQNVNIEYRWAEGNIARLPELAKDLVRQKVDIILAGGSVGAEAAKHATSLIPIVAAGVGDLVELGLVTSLARPDGNLTGFVAAAPETAAKRFQLIKEIKPEARRAAVLWNSANSNAKLEWNVAREFATTNNYCRRAPYARDVEEFAERAGECSAIGSRCPRRSERSSYVHVPENCLSSLMSIGAVGIHGHPWPDVSRPVRPQRAVSSEP
jgi:ABC transporter substrate binding protein